MAEARTEDQQIKEYVWQYTGWGALLLSVFLAGVAAGYLWWGDAAALRVQVEDLGQKIHGVRAEKENIQVQVNRLQRENEKLTQENQQLKAGAGQ